ncbi:hypothetical protein [Bacillus sp. ISL-7]|uniref:hypothetical protein n=1 Tax=Bacillus sp. ISL-7 TaxID=2819136 RepID=UPI001BEC19CA|nr:hypothetical protein [Bacillus sp. ISL-7]MBT2737979.1 hypothetical protein [Bacillus sp. ISL-7]
MFLILGLSGLYISNSVKIKYQNARDNFINQFIDNKDLSNKDIKKIANSIKEFNKKFHTFEDLAIFHKEKGIVVNQYSHLDYKNAEFLFPLDAKQKDNLITKGFRVTEEFTVGNFVIVHNYFPDWYYLLPISLFMISAILLIIWFSAQMKYGRKNRLLKIKQI